MVSFRSFLGVAALAVTVAAVPIPQYSSGYGDDSSYGDDNNNDDNSGYNSASDSSYNNNNGYSTASASSYNNNNNNNNNYGYGSSSSSSSSSEQYNTGYNNNNYNTGYNQYSTQTQDSTSKTTTTTQAQYTSSSTTSSYQAYTTTSYGSGSNNWGNSDYNDCVNQCLASFTPSSAMYTPSATTGSGYGQSSGSAGTNGVTHTVIVAPTQGVLRYVPFTVNASVGDTVAFHWNANDHTVTKGSELLLCNKTADAPFTSGTQNQGFVYNQVVNDTSPTFYFCNTPGHCEKGMFGIINPPSNFQAPSSISGSMGNLVANSSTLAAVMTYTNNMTSGDSRAANWGNNIDLAQLPAWSHESVAENTLYTRAFLAANPNVYKQDGSIDLSGSTPLVIPADIAATLQTATTSAPAANNAAAPAGAANAASSSPAAAVHNGARGVAPSMLVAVASVAVAFFAL